jgi:hypothetical protein
LDGLARRLDGSKSTAPTARREELGIDRTQLDEPIEDISGGLAELDLRGSGNERPGQGTPH